MLCSWRVSVLTATQIPLSNWIAPSLSQMLYFSGVSCTEGIFEYVQVLSKKISWKVSLITSMERKNVPTRISQCPLLGLPSCLKVFLITQFTQRNCQHIWWGTNLWSSSPMQSVRAPMPIVSVGFICGYESSEKPTLRSFSTSGLRIFG